MRFEIPQFIGVEDKVFGPLTIKQFIYLAGAGSLAFIVYKYLPKYFSIPLALILVTLGLALAFYKVNNKPFIFLMEAGFKYLVGTRLYVWEKRERPVTPRKDYARTPLISVPKISNSKLKDLTWTLDVKEGTNPGTAETYDSKIHTKKAGFTV